MSGVAGDRKGFEVHEHAWISGPNANRGRRVVHSHERGDEPHTHPNTGPGSYTIDKDDWGEVTGLQGGGRKKFTKQPTGEQLEFVPRGRVTFDVYVSPGIETVGGEDDNGQWPGAIGLATARMVMGFGLVPVFKSIDSLPNIRQLELFPGESGTVQ